MPVRESTLLDITHLVTVSCTGFFNPGPDYKIVRALGLNPAVQRYHLGFMGCYAAFPALRAAKSFCEADPDAVVLVVCAELCSLHVRTSNDPDTIMGSALFADGAAAAIVTAREDPGRTRAAAAGPLRDGPDAGRRGIHGVEHRRRRLRDGPGQLRPAHHRRPHHRRPGTAAVPGELPAGTPLPGHPALGHPSRRPQHPGQGPVQAGPQRRTAGPGPGNAAQLRQHEQRHGAVRAPAHPRPAAGRRLHGRRATRERICSMAFGPGTDRGNRAVHQAHRARAARQRDAERARPTRLRAAALALPESALA